MEQNVRVYFNHCFWSYPCRVCPSYVITHNRAHTFEFVLHFVKCDTVTVSLNQIIILLLLCNAQYFLFFPHPSSAIACILFSLFPSVAPQRSCFLHRFCVSPAHLYSVSSLFMSVVNVKMKNAHTEMTYHSKIFWGAISNS